MRRRRAGRAAGLAALVWLGTASAASAVDWSRHAEQPVVEIVTWDEEGRPGTTKVWLAVVDGEAYVRTGNTRWGRNVERQPEVRILTDDGDYDLRVEFVTDAALRERVSRAFREKYGWTDRLIGPFRGPNPKVMHLLPRDPAP